MLRWPNRTRHCKSTVRPPREIAHGKSDSLGKHPLIGQSTCLSRGGLCPLFDTFSLRIFPTKDSGPALDKGHGNVGLRKVKDNGRSHRQEPARTRNWLHPKPVV
jgi:hypothetical protein